MREYGLVQSGIYESEKFRELGALGKLTFLYLLTSHRQNQTGVAEIAPRHIAFDLDVSKPEAEEALEALETVGLIERDRAAGLIRVVQFMRHSYPRWSPVFASKVVELLRPETGVIPIGDLRTRTLFEFAGSVEGRALTWNDTRDFNKKLVQDISRLVDNEFRDNPARAAKCLTQVMRGKNGPALAGCSFLVGHLPPTVKPTVEPTVKLTVEPTVGPTLRVYRTELEEEEKMKGRETEGEGECKGGGEGEEGDEPAAPGDPPSPPADGGRSDRDNVKDIISDLKRKAAKQ